jgi:hypothetical protein
MFQLDSPSHLLHLDPQIVFGLLLLGITSIMLLYGGRKSH